MQRLIMMTPRSTQSLGSPTQSRPLNLLFRHCISLRFNNTQLKNVSSVWRSFWLARYSSVCLARMSFTEIVSSSGQRQVTYVHCADTRCHIELNRIEQAIATFYFQLSFLSFLYIVNQIMLDSTVLVGHCDLKQSLLHASVQIALTLELIWSFRNHSDFHGKAECPLVLIKSLEHKVFVHLC